MIASLAYSGLYLACGVLMVRFLLPRHRPVNRLWLGASMGLLLEMWLPALLAFAVSFSLTAHLAAAAILVPLTAIVYCLRDERPAAPWDGDERRMLRTALLWAVPLTLFSAYLQVTHVMRPDAAGNWHVGQSTYGDLPMHLSFITNLVGKSFPADYPFYPGARLSYPFLTDSLSSTWVLLGASLQAATVIPAVWMMALCYTGVLVLGRELTAGRRTMILAAMLFFFNGGLGFLYDFDLAGGIDAEGRLTVLSRLRHILEGWYQTPTNQPDPNNLRWSNVIADLMIPQRTLLGGWCMVIPCLYLLDAAFRPRQRERLGGPRAVGLLGVWAGALPLIHTHSFLALALASLGALLYDLIHGDPRALGLDRSRWRILRPYLVYGAVAAALSLPQLVCFTFAQTFRAEEAHSFLTFQFNWVNNRGGNGMRDLYLWFYIKNIGLPFLALLLALFEKKPRWRRLFAMALPIILAAELIRFQPNEYDNNKLFYLAWLLCCMIAADWAGEMWARLKGLQARPVIALLTGTAVFLSAGLTLWREAVSDYVAFSADAVEAGEFIRDETDRDAVFLSGTQHLNPALSIAGRTVVCGPDLWLYWHGFDTSARQEEIRQFMEDPDHHTDILTEYDVDYIYISSYERSNYAVDEEALERNYPIVFENREATVYQVPEG